MPVPPYKDHTSMCDLCVQRIRGSFSFPALIDANSLTLTRRKNVVWLPLEKPDRWHSPRKHPVRLRCPSSLVYFLFLSLRLTHSRLHFFSVSSPLKYQGMKRGIRSEVKKMGPLKVAHLNGLSVSRQPMHDEVKDDPETASNDERVGHLRVLDFCQWFAHWKISL